MKVNFEELEQKYGSEFVTELKKDIEFRELSGDKWKLEVVRIGKYTDRYMLATNFDVVIYDVYPNRLRSKRIIGYTECKKALQLMQEMEEME